MTAYYDRAYFYSVEGDESAQKVPFTSAHAPDPVTWVAEDAASAYFQLKKMEGTTWPKTFTVYTSNDVELGTCTVDIDTDPTFNARVVVATKTSSEDDDNE